MNFITYRNPPQIINNTNKESGASKEDLNLKLLCQLQLFTYIYTSGVYSDAVMMLHVVEHGSASYTVLI